MRRIKISWLCSIYRGSNFDEFKLAIESIFKQKGGYQQEIVIVQDGPLNKDKKKFTYFIKNKKKSNIIKLIKLKENKGLGNALKEGTKYCAGDYIARFDTDDINLDNRLIKQIPIIERNKNIAVLGSYVKEFLPTNNEKIKVKIKKTPSKKYLKVLMNFYNPMNHPSVIIRKKALKNVQYSHMPFFEDYYLWLKLKKDGWDFENIQETTVYMKVDSYHKKRWGIKYAQSEFKFMKIILSENLVPLLFLPFFIFRIITRLFISRRIQKLIRNFKETTFDINPIL